MTILFILKNSLDFLSLRVPKLLLIAYLAMSQLASDPNCDTYAQSMIKLRKNIEDVLEEAKLTMEQKEVFWNLVFKIDIYDMKKAYSNW